MSVPRCRLSHLILFVRFIPACGGNIPVAEVGQAETAMSAARAAAERVLRGAALALTDMQATLRIAKTAHRPARRLVRARHGLSREHRVQEARAAFERGDYLDVLRLLADPTALPGKRTMAPGSPRAVKVKHRRR